MPPPTLSEKLEAFARRWATYRGTEQAGAQSFLNELLDIYDVRPSPGGIFEQHPVRVREAEPQQGALFGRGAETRAAADRMDMYLPRICVWEMKSPEEKDLDRHLPQVLGFWSYVRTRYVVLCNFREVWIFDADLDGGQLSPAAKIPLDRLAEQPGALVFLRGEHAHFARRPERVSAAMASELGGMLRELFRSSEDLGRDREQIAWFVLQCVFAMFAEDADLAPRGMFSRALDAAGRARTMAPVHALFDDFARNELHEKANEFAPYVDGTLFDHSQPRVDLPLRYIDALREAATAYDWQDTRPEIFGSIFEQALDPVERHEIGAHFTREEDILRIVMPTIVTPWRERIAAVRTTKDAEALIAAMRSFHILDPACGCGNFLYVAYREMKRLEAGLRRAWTQASRRVAKRRKDLVPPPGGPYFTLDQVHGIEINPFAARLSRVVLWIGEHLAKREVGLDEETLPLKNLDENVVEGDALEVPWPRPDGELAIVGNPPYLGVRKMRAELGDERVERLFAAYPQNRAADLVTYWYTAAPRTMRPGERAGFVSTNSVTQNESREASLDSVVAAGGTIADAWRTCPWPGEAAVHISIVNWVMSAQDGARTLDGTDIEAIPTALSRTLDVTGARTIEANEGIAFMGVTPGNKDFVLDDDQRREILEEDPLSEAVIKPFLVGRDVNRDPEQRPSRWIVDFGTMDRE